jgi:hypothetical protein
MQSIYRYDAGQAVVNGVILVATQVVAEAGKGGDCPWRSWVRAAPERGNDHQLGFWMLLDWWGWRRIPYSTVHHHDTVGLQRWIVQFVLLRTRLWAAFIERHRLECMARCGHCTHVAEIRCVNSCSRVVETGDCWWQESPVECSGAA